MVLYAILIIFYRHFVIKRLLTKKSEKQFLESYSKWAKKKGYRQNESKAKQIYALAKEGIPTLPSSTPSTKMLVQESVKIVREVDDTLTQILTRMSAIAKMLPEYQVVHDTAFCFGCL